MKSLDASTLHAFKTNLEDRPLLSSWCSLYQSLVYLDFSGESGTNWTRHQMVMDLNQVNLQEELLVVLLMTWRLLNLRWRWNSNLNDTSNSVFLWLNILVTSLCICWIYQTLSRAWVTRGGYNLSLPNPNKLCQIRPDMICNVVKSRCNKRNIRVISPLDQSKALVLFRTVLDKYIWTGFEWR